MAGQFSRSNRPTRPGAFFNFEPTPSEVIPPSIGSIVAIPFTHDWGPDEVVVSVSSLAEWKSIYGPSEDTQGFRMAKQAFQGEGLSGRLGAGTVLAYRMVGAAAANASRILTNTTPATALTLTSRYKGARGNDLRVTTRDKAGDATKTELVIYDGTVEVERYEFLDADIAAVAAAINASSNWVTAVMAVDGTPLTLVTSQALTAGDDGSTVLAADYTDFMADLDPERFSVVAVESTDTAIQASLRTWCVNHNSAGKRFFLVVGGAAAESAATAITRSTAMADPNIVNIGVGTVTDDDFGSLGSGQLTARLAGIIARKGGMESITYSRLKGLTITAGATDAEVSAAFEGGVNVLARDSNLTAPVRLERGVTTWTSESDAATPYLIYRNPKFVRTMHEIQLGVQEWAETYVIGQRVVNDRTREWVVSEVSRRMTNYEALGMVQAGWSVGVDQDPAPSDDDDFVALKIGLRFGRSLEQVFISVSIA